MTQGMTDEQLDEIERQECAYQHYPVIQKLIAEIRRLRATPDVETLKRVRDGFEAILSSLANSSLSVSALTLQIKSLGEEARHGIDTLLAKPVADGWMPIESAPKDGTPILVRYNYAQREKYVTEASWHDANGWCGNMLAGLRATHWQPLPAPPQKGSV